MSKKLFILALSSSIITFSCASEPIPNFDNFAYLDAQYAASSQISTVSETTPEATLEAIQKKTHVVIDVREQNEYDEVHIKDIKLMPLSNLAQSTAKLDKKLNYITVCRSGVRSAKAADEMQKIGLNVVTMKGGMISWIQKGLPVVKPVRKR